MKNIVILLFQYSSCSFAQSVTDIHVKIRVMADNSQTPLESTVVMVSPKDGIETYLGETNKFNDYTLDTVCRKDDKLRAHPHDNVLYKRSDAEYALDIFNNHGIIRVQWGIAKMFLQKNIPRFPNRCMANDSFRYIPSKVSLSK